MRTYYSYSYTVSVISLFVLMLGHFFLSQQSLRHPSSLCHGGYTVETLATIYICIPITYVPTYTCASFETSFYFHYPTRDLQGSLRLMEQGVTIFTQLITYSLYSLARIHWPEYLLQHPICCCCKLGLIFFLCT